MQDESSDLIVKSVDSVRGVVRRLWGVALMLQEKFVCRKIRKSVDVNIQ